MKNVKQKILSFTEEELAALTDPTLTAVINLILIEPNAMICYAISINFGNKLVL
jgi:hypothetical protein